MAVCPRSAQTRQGTPGPIPLHCSAHAHQQARYFLISGGGGRGAGDSPEARKAWGGAWRPARQAQSGGRNGEEA